MALAGSAKRLFGSNWWSQSTRVTCRQTPLCRGLFGKRGTMGPHSKVLGHANNDIYEMQSELFSVDGARVLCLPLQLTTLNLSI